MRRFILSTTFIFTFMSVAMSQLSAEPSELVPVAAAPVKLQALDYYENPKETLVEDPDFVFEEYELPSLYEADAAYYQNRKKLGSFESVTEGRKLFTLGVGEVNATVTKDQVTRVFGFFKNYFGVAEIGVLGVEKMELILDMNSYDTGIPVQNNRIIGLVFESMKPQLSTTRVILTEFDYGDGKTFSQIGNGETHKIQAKGTVSLNEITQDITMTLQVKNDAGMWLVESASPLVLLLSDFAFRDKPYEFMKDTNIKSIKNAIEVNVKLALR